MISLLNAALFYLCWFIAVIGAANGHPLLGPIAIAAMIGVHLVLLKDRWIRELKIILVVTLLGTSIDCINPIFGFVTFNTDPELFWGYPLWMVSLWAGFATTLSTSLKWMEGRALWAFLLGFLGGPMSFWAGERLGAFFFPKGTFYPLIINALEWGIALPIFFKIAQQLRSQP